jgi:hypothetical protein
MLNAAALARARRRVIWPILVLSLFMSDPSLFMGRARMALLGKVSQSMCQLWRAAKALL